MITSNTGNFANISNEINIDVDLWAQDDREQENDSSRYFYPVFAKLFVIKDHFLGYSM